MSKSSNRGRSRNAFTLVEMLVSLAILLVLGAALLSMLSSVITNWQQEQARGERRSTARRVLTSMTRDLSLASQPLNSSDTTTLQFLIDPPAANLAPYLLPHALFWQAPVATDASSAAHQGNIAVVGYFIRWVNLNACLCRLLINPSDADYALYSSPSDWVSPTLLDNHAPASKPDYKGLIGENVLGLWAQPLDANGNPIAKTSTGAVYTPGAYDSRKGYSLVSGAGATYVYGPSALPAAVRLGIVVIDSRTAHRLTAKVTPASTTSDFFADIHTFIASLPPSIQAGAEAYTQVVSLPHVPQ